MARKPVGWRGESARHAMAARGIKTARPSAKWWERSDYAGGFARWLWEYYGPFTGQDAYQVRKTVPGLLSPGYPYYRVGDHDRQRIAEWGFDQGLYEVYLDDLESFEQKVVETRRSYRSEG